jgi:hypothetical protein
MPCTKHFHKESHSVAKKSKYEINVTEEARKRGIPPHVLHGRLNRGWSMEDALGKPVRLKKPRRKTAAKKKTANKVAPVSSPLNQVAEAKPSNDTLVAGYLTLAIIVILVALAVLNAG